MNKKIERPLARFAVDLLRAVPDGGAPFALAGGTALAIYLDHRDSNDLDLFCRPGDFPGASSILPSWEKHGAASEPVFVNQSAGANECW